jgi:hypothetical protein
MKHIKTLEQYNNSNIYSNINSIMESNIHPSEIDELIEEGFFSFLKGLFTNPKKKRELDRLVAKLVETRVEIAKIDIQENNIEEFENELEDKTDPYTNPKAKGSKFTAKVNFDDNDPTQIKKAQLEKLEEEILDGMDKIGEENDTLAKYVNKIKLDSRIEATDKIMKMADSEIKKALSKLKKKDQKASKDLAKEIKEEM